MLVYIAWLLKFGLKKFLKDDAMMISDDSSSLYSPILRGSPQIKWS